MKLQETLEEAVIRECFEEAKVRFEVGRIVFIHGKFFLFKMVHIEKRNFINYHSKLNEVKVKYESYTSDGIEERLEWLSISNLQDAFLFPEFFKLERTCLSDEIKHFVTVEKKNIKKTERITPLQLSLL